MTAAPSDARVRCVLVHGYLDGPRVWARIVGRLPQQRVGVVSVRLAPVGDANATSAQLLEAYAAQVRLACECSGEALLPVVLVGHSMGGAVVELAASAGIAGLAGVVLVTPSSLRGVPLPGPVMQRFHERAALMDRAEIRAGKRSLAISLDDEAAEILASSTLETGTGFAREQLRAWTGGHPTGEGSADVRVPVRVVTTEDRFFTAAHLAREAQRFADCEIAHVAGAGHWPQLEQPQQLANVIEAFLTDIARRAPALSQRPVSRA